MKKRMFLKGALLGLVMMVTAQSTMAVKINTNEVVVGQRADAKTLDPQRSIDTISNRVMDSMYERLLQRNEDMTVAPSLAKSWKQLDNLTTVFYLKEGVKFHNGEEMTSEDVVYSLNRARSSAQTGYNYALITEVKALDKYTVEIKTSQPFGAMLSYLAHSGSSIVNKKYTEEIGDKLSQNPMGTGPFKLKEWISGDRISMERFEDYHGEKAKSEFLTIKIIPEVTNRTIALETGEVDLAFDIGALDKEYIKTHKKLDLQEVDSPGILYLGFDSENPLFKNNVKLKQAIAYAIDNKVIADTVYMGGATPADSPLSPVLPGYDQNIKKYHQNLEMSKKLLAEAGYPNGLDIELWSSNTAEWLDTATILQDQLKQVGINLEIVTFEWGTYVSKTAFPKKPLYLLTWTASTVDPDQAMYPLFRSDEHGSSGNRSFFTNKKMDDILMKARTSTDQAERMALYKEAQNIVQEELPHYTLVYPKNNIGLSKELQGAVLYKNGYLNFAKTYKALENKIAKNDKKSNKKLFYK